MNAISDGSKVWVKYEHRAYNTYSKRRDWTVRRTHEDGTFDVTNRRSERINRIDPSLVTRDRSVVIEWETAEREADDRARAKARALGDWRDRGRAS